MKRRARSRTAAADRDTIRPEYDFSRAVRGMTAARYAEGANGVLIDPEVLDGAQSTCARHSATSWRCATSAKRLTSACA